MKKIGFVLISALVLSSCSHQSTEPEKSADKTADKKAIVKESPCNELRKTAAPKKFEDFDANKDKSVSRDEYICLTMKRFTTMDQDHDLFLSKKELKNAGNWKATADQNGDGKVSMIEYSFAAEVAFTTVDDNKDGAINGKESGEALP